VAMFLLLGQPCCCSAADPKYGSAAFTAHASWFNNFGKNVCACDLSIVSSHQCSRAPSAAWRARQTDYIQAPSCCSLSTQTSSGDVFNFADFAAANAHLRASA
jgi:hypothetical protein